MKSKMRKKLIAFMLCMVLVICNSVSILADTPAAETTTAEKQVKETQSTKDESASEEDKTTESKEDTSKQSDKETAPETKTTEKKEETTEATTEKKEESTTEATTKAKEETTTAEKKETTTAEEGKETSEASDKNGTEEEKNTETKDEENAVTELTYENDDVIVTVSEVAEGAIPEGAELKVVPILKDDEETAEQYEEVVKELQDKSEKEEYAIAGFLAYDITFVDADGNEIEPNGEVKVSMEYAKKTAPIELEDDEILADTNVTVMHLEEDGNGQVKDVVDMSENDQLKKIDTTDKKEVKTAEFVTESFSVYTITWQLEYGVDLELRTHYGYMQNGEFVEFDESTGGSKYISDYKEVIDLNDYISQDLSDAPENYEFHEIRLLNPTTGSTDCYLKIERERKGGLFHYYEYTLMSSQNDNSNSYEIVSDDYENFNFWSNLDPVDIYYIYENTNSGGGEDPVIPPEESQNPLGEPEHKKTIEKKDDGSYTLSLDVTGKQGDVTPIDVLLIVDASDSMTNSRVSNVNNAISILKTQLQNADIEADIHMSAVMFNGPTRTGSENYPQSSRNGDAWVEEDWTSLENFNFRLSTSDCDGGTNWQAGVRKGEEQLQKRANENSKKYVIFLTDGDPTFRYYEGDSTQTIGTGTNDDRGYNYNAAVNEWNSSTYLSNPTTVKYVVDATGTSYNQCDDFAKAISGTELAGGNSTALNNSFEQIAENITAPSYTNVSIYDTLSEYVEFASNPNLQVFADGETLNSNQYTYTINRNNGSIRVDLLNGEALGKDVTYKITFDIVPSQKAYEDYAVNDETDKYDGMVGDEGTDTNLENPTSSNQPGFRSNERAYVSYSENGGSQLEADYKHPVIQVDESSVPETPEPGEPELSPPAHQKYIKDNENGNYTLSLDVTGKLGEADPIDILLIVDKSGSMKDDDNGKGYDKHKRYENVNAAVNTLISSLKGANVDTEINLRAITFSENASYENQRWLNLDNIKQGSDLCSLTSQECVGGTNWHAGINLGEQAFENRDSKKYVIFLTDGVPTYAYNESGNRIGNGYEYQSNIAQCYEATLKGWNSTTILRDSATTKYVVDVSGGAAGDYCDNFAAHVNGQGAVAIKGNNQTQLTNAFANIADDITRPAYNSIVISDTLSDYVDFANGEQTKVTVSTCTKTLNDDGTFTITSKNPLDSFKYTVSINEENKTITVDLTGVGKLEEDVTYLVEFDVTLTDAAYAEYAQNGYGNVTGDPFTDAPGNITSSGKPGLHSNDEATISYKVDNSAVQEERYDHPVVQPELEIVSKTVKKAWNGTPAESVQIQLSAGVDSNNDGVIDQNLTHDNYNSLPENMTIELTGENDNWEYTWDNLPKYFYRTTATGTVEKFEIQYNIDEINVPDGYTKEVGQEQNNVTTITNTKIAYLEVVKNWDTSALKDNSSGDETPSNPDGGADITDGEISHAPISVGLFKKGSDGEETLVQDSIVELSDGNNWYYRYSVNAQELTSYIIKEIITENGEYKATVDDEDKVIIKDEIGDSAYDNIYTVTYGEPTQNSETGNQRITITNSLKLGSIEITKTNTDDNPTPAESLLPGAVFKVTNAAGEEIATVTTGDEESGQKGIAKVSNLLPGEYTITEIQSPEGYSLLANPVTVVVGTTEGDSTTGNYYEVVNDDNRHYFDLKLKVINNKLFTMPEAGGRNIFMLTLAGTAMIALAAGSTIYYRRRRGVHNKTRR